MNKYLTLIILLIISSCSNNNIKYEDTTYKNNDITNKQDYEVPEIELCSFNGKNYILPENAYCTNGTNKYNAWLCNFGYYESGDTCIFGKKPEIKSNVNCNIKGNISFTTGEKIYHYPGCEYYNATKIDTRYGEKWFCTEQEAINAGWRKAYNCY